MLIDEGAVNLQRIMSDQAYFDYNLNAAFAMINKPNQNP